MKPEEIYHLYVSEFNRESLTDGYCILSKVKHESAPRNWIDGDITVFRDVDGDVQFYKWVKRDMHFRWVKIVNPDIHRAVLAHIFPIRV